MVRTELNCRRTISCRRPTTTGAGRTASPVSPADGLPCTASDSTSTVRTAQFTPPHQTTQDGPVCVVSGACQLSRPDRRTSAFSVSECVRRSHCAARHTPTLNALVGRSVHSATPDTTRRSCLCRVGCGGVNWSIAVNVHSVRLNVHCTCLSVPHHLLTELCLS